MKLALFGILLVFNLSLFGQHRFTVVNRDTIKKAISDDTSPTAYAKLIDRFNAFDTTLTLEDYRLLYYGFVFQDIYLSDPDEKKRAIIKSLNEKDFDHASLLCDSVLSKYPVSLAANYYKAVALFRAHPDNTEFLKYRDRFGKLVEAIFSSGDGLTCESGVRVISVSDEYMIIYSYLRTQKFKGQSLVGHCDLLEIEPSGNWPGKDIYFDASEVLKREQSMLFGK